MNFYSLNFNSKDVNFLEAVQKGLAPDRGLYFPKHIPKLPNSFFEELDQKNNAQIAFESILPFVGNAIPENSLQQIVHDTLSFDFPIVPLTNRIASLELFHGPTLAFKDVGARFMARCLAYANAQKSKKELTILVATSGDTGGAVADGFYGVEGIKVVILYPKGKVSSLQEKQLTTLGKNITALEVEGVFDDCQDMVKSAFIDPEINSEVNLTSANSINIARWLAQMFYYFIGFKNRPHPDKKLVVSVPSGNFGNLCAGLMAKQMGLPIDHFIAATNINDTVPQFLTTGEYQPKPSEATLSNAMDVGDPSNFIRIQKLYNNDFFKLKKAVSGYSYTDADTLKALKSIYKNTGYIADPHGAVGYLGLKEFLENNPEEYSGLFLETAHPIKFSKSVESAIKTQLKVPEKLKALLEREKISLPIKDYKELKSYLLNR
ncbi:MAG: threonine synthase [Bacteroidetes bacterium]|nr:threonine synthase [Bacteroidota bacterium]